MRRVINISLPESLGAEVEREIRRSRFASKSEFFRHLFRLWLEGKLAADLEESRTELTSGKGRMLKSLKDLR